MNFIHIEPFAGISGDMFLGALLDLGADLSILKAQLDSLHTSPLLNYELASEKRTKAGIRATKFLLKKTAENVPDESPRNLGAIREMIVGSGLSDWVKRASVDAFSRLAQVEGKVHGQSAEEVHFHEIGAVDSIVDTVGSFIALEQFLPATFSSSPVNVGRGVFECAHGLYPVPGPATQELLKGIPSYSNQLSGELTTPTGALLLTALGASFGPRPPMKILATGYGSGSRDLSNAPNVLRITLGEQCSVGEDLSDSGTEVAVIEASIDDMNPQIYSYFQKRALDQGALDVYFTAIQMKKNRPAVKLTVMCDPVDVDAMARLIFAETTTIGIRYSHAYRKTLQRRHVSVDTQFGRVRVKVSLLDGRVVNFVPEYEDCWRLASDKKVALKLVQAGATQAYLQQERESE